MSLTRLLTSLMAKSLERFVYNQFLPVPNPSMIFLTVTWHPRYSCTSQLVHPFTANCVKGEMCISSTCVDVFDRDSKVIKSWYNRFSVFEWVALLPRHCSFSTSCNRRMSIWLQGTSLVWSLTRKHTRQVFTYLDVNDIHHLSSPTKIFANNSSSNQSCFSLYNTWNTAQQSLQRIEDYDGVAHCG